MWIYDLRINLHITLKENPLKWTDLDDLLGCYNPKSSHQRTDSERLKSFTYDELMKRDMVKLDIFWLKDDALEESANLPTLAIIAAEIAADLEGSAGTIRNFCRGFEGKLNPKKQSIWRGEPLANRKGLVFNNQPFPAQLWNVVESLLLI